MTGKLSANDFAAFLISRAEAKDGYIMGAIGQDPKKLSSWYYNQYSGSQKTKALYWKANAQRVWDCQGLADGYVSEKLGEKINVRARNNYANWCKVKGEGLIPADMRVVGAAVFWGSRASSITHIAFLVKPVNADNPSGDWYMVEARGVNSGVVTTKLLSRKPKYWGLMDKYFSYDAKPVGNEYECTGNGVNVRSGAGTEFASVGKLYKRDAVVPIKIPVGWSPILYDGQVRFISDKYIQKKEA